MGILTSKLGRFVLFVLVAWYVVTYPRQAAGATRSALGFLESAAGAAATFLSALG